jgi:hypothetical protein
VIIDQREILMNQYRKELTRTEGNMLFKTLDLAIGVRVPASQPNRIKELWVPTAAAAAVPDRTAWRFVADGRVGKLHKVSFV